MSIVDHISFFKGIERRVELVIVAILIFGTRDDVVVIREHLEFYLLCSHTDSDYPLSCIIFSIAFVGFEGSEGLFCVV